MQTQISYGWPTDPTICTAVLSNKARAHDLTSIIQRMGHITALLLGISQEDTPLSGETKHCRFCNSLVYIQDIPAHEYLCVMGLLWGTLADNGIPCPLCGLQGNEDHYYFCFCFFNTRKVDAFPTPAMLKTLHCHICDSQIYTPEQNTLTTIVAKGHVKTHRAAPPVAVCRPSAPTSRVVTTKSISNTYRLYNFNKEYKQQGVTDIPFTDKEQLYDSWSMPLHLGAKQGRTRITKQTAHNRGSGYEHIFVDKQPTTEPLSQEPQDTLGPKKERTSITKKNNTMNLSKELSLPPTTQSFSPPSFSPTKEPSLQPLSPTGSQKPGPLLMQKQRTSITKKKLSLPPTTQSPGPALSPIPPMMQGPKKGYSKKNTMLVKSSLKTALNALGVKSAGKEVYPFLEDMLQQGMIRHFIKNSTPDRVKYTSKDLHKDMHILF